MYGIQMRKMDIEAALQEATISELLIDGIKVVDITLTDALHKTAAVYGLGIRRLCDANRVNGNGLKEVFGGNIEREVAAKEGELAASFYLLGDVESVIRRWTMGIADSGDLTICQDHRQKVIDVKIRTQPYHRCFTLTLKQWLSHSPDYYVITQYPSSDREQVRIRGYIERSKIDSLVTDETKRILGQPLKWTYEGVGAEKQVRLIENNLKALIASLEKSIELDRLSEKEVNLGGIGDLGFGPVIAIPFDELRQIGELKRTMNS
jgi:hypothetical protein